MTDQTSKAHHLREWMFRENGGVPTLAIVSFLVKDGAFSLLLNKETLLELSQAFAEKAEKMPYKKDQH